MADPVNSPDEAVMAAGKYDPRDTDRLPEDQYPSRKDEVDPVPAETDETGAYFLRRARRAYEDSTDYIDNSIRRTWDDSIHNFRGEHPSGSKYGQPSYKGRSKLFRPKTRSSIKQHLAAFAAAAFANQDLTHIEAANQNSAMGAAAAKLLQKLTQYRMTHQMRWILKCLGAYQDTKVYGVCISRQEWKYEEWEDVDYEIAYDAEGNPRVDEFGDVLGYEQRRTRVVADEPIVHLVSPENFRFNVNCDWSDPIGTSDFLIEQIPMIAADVLSMMDKIDPRTGQPTWRQYTLSEILAAGHYADSAGESTTRQTRAGNNRTDPADAHQGDESTLVWAHLNIIQEQGQDYVFWSLGREKLLTDPVPIEDVFPQGRELYKMGISDIEAHRVYPSSDAEQGADIQEAINEVTNQRIDNVRLALNKRFFIKRQKQGHVDLQALMRSVPGGGVMVDDPEDVKVVETKDVTSSAYSEQDRLAVEMDELLGNFSQGSVLNNRALNETVGGMNLMSSGANAVQELSIRIFIETWMVPVIRDLIRLEKMYETDVVVLGLAGDQAEIFKELEEQPNFDELLKQDLLVTVNVGMGHTSPSQKIEKLSMAISTLAQFPDQIQRLNTDEIAKEVFSHVGYADGERFVRKEDEMPEPEGNPEMDVKMQELADRKEIAMGEIELKRELGYAQLALKENLTVAELETRIGIDDRKNKTVRDMAAVREANKERELALKAEMGSGI